MSKKFLYTLAFTIISIMIGASSLDPGRTAQHMPNKLW
jgi:hypothetical protein